MRVRSAGPKPPIQTCEPNSRAKDASPATNAFDDGVSAFQPPSQTSQRGHTIANTSYWRVAGVNGDLGGQLGLLALRPARYGREVQGRGEGGDRLERPLARIAPLTGFGLAA